MGGGWGRDGGRKTGNVASIHPVKHEKWELPYMALQAKVVLTEEVGFCPPICHCSPTCSSHYGSPLARRQSPSVLREGGREGEREGGREGGREVKGGLWAMRSVAYLPVGMCVAGSEALAVSLRCQQRCYKGQTGAEGGAPG